MEKILRIIKTSYFYPDFMNNLLEDDKTSYQILISIKKNGCSSCRNRAYNRYLRKLSNDMFENQEKFSKTLDFLKRRFRLEL